MKQKSRELETLEDFLSLARVLQQRYLFESHIESRLRVLIDIAENIVLDAYREERKANHDEKK